MPRLQEYDVIPGQTRTMSLTAKGLDCDSAVLSIGASTAVGATPVLTKTITKVSSGDGVITIDGADSLLSFVLAPADTELLSPVHTFYPFSVRVTTATGQVYDMPLGKVIVGDRVEP